MALSFDDLLEAENGINVALGLDIQDTLFDFDNSSSDIIQAGSIKTVGKWQKKSPFHESDSGMSEDFCSVGSPESVSEEHSGKMLDELVESLDIEPFCGGSDKDLADYFGGNISPDPLDDCTDVTSSYQPAMVETQTSDSDESCPSSPEVTQRSLRGRKVRGKAVSDETKAVNAQIVSKPVSVCNVNSSLTSGISSVKVLKVIKTSGTANTAFEVLQALEDRNKKNAVQAKVNREKKKNYIRCLEDEVSILKERNGHLKTENDSMKQRTSSLEEEVEYLRAVLANESSLSKLLGNIENVQNVKLKSSFASHKRSAEMDHDYFPSKRSRATPVSTAGVCLHVDNDTVSLEFCSKCSSMAKSTEDD